MRPLPGDDAFLRPRAADHDGTPTAFSAGGSSPQMSYIIADEASIDASLASTAAFQPSRKDRKAHATETPAGAANTDSGGPSLSHHVAPHHSQHHHHGGEGRDEHEGETDGSIETPENALSGHAQLGGAEASLSLRNPAVPNPSQPMTPILIGASGPTSVLSSVSSRRNSLSGSLSEDLASHAPSVADEHEADQEPAMSSMMDSGSAPQLIMPSIKMPSRRPFTPEGKSMGRLKVLIAGANGVGKTSLIKAIVQSCDHIVHVDPIAPSSAGLVQKTTHVGKAKGRRHSAGIRTAAEFGTSQITEIYASTKPYPEWWSEMDDLTVLRRRKSLGDTVLDRNICFVDTPGYGVGSLALSAVNPVVQYVESHLQQMNSNSLADSDLLKMLGGDGGVQVDVVFYMISGRLKPVDIHYLQKLGALTNVIPLLAQSDLMSAEDIASSREQIESQLKAADIRPFSFTMHAGAGTQGLYAISSATGSDHDTMDASLLMSPDYVQPLHPTELASLVEHVFTHDGASQLRHSAARKYIQWRKGEIPTRPLDLLQQPLSMTSSYAHSRQSSQVLTPPLGATSSYALARVTDHTQREERLAQIRLANWAADLQKSLANERAQYESLATSERAIWLTERLNECVLDGQLVPASRARRGRRASVEMLREKIRRKLGESASTTTAAHQDPLGLLEVAADLRHKGLLALELLSSLGVLGGLALWVSKHYWHFQAYEWILGEWEKFWGGGR
ncbi:hypothetical protein GQ53DRAFT_682273 [Thozetella sp. PMI_491]|nr:hypothetical protein GQ53DRAFT_682273 [Thozetella sp. PMI_491]